MNRQIRFRFRSSLFVAALGLGLPIGTATADTIWYKSAPQAGASAAEIARAAAAKPFKRDDIKIERVDGDDIVFVPASGNEAKRPLAEVTRIAMDDEPALTGAEEAFEGAKLADAIAGYRKAAGASSRLWVRQRAALRLIESGNKAPDFGAAVAGFATLATIDAAAAGKMKPTIPVDATKSALTGAIRDTQNAEGTTGIKPEQLRVLLNFQIELQTVAHDTDGASATLKQLTKLGGSAAPADNTTPGGTPADNTAVVRARAEEKINEARVALAQKDYKHASEILAVAGDGIVAPDQQDEAMFMIAEAKAGLAGDDPRALMDAAIAYMRVVANFGKTQGAAHIAESLMKTAAIEEKLSKPEEALRIYNEVAGVYKGTPSAQDAADSSARISAALKPRG